MYDASRTFGGQPWHLRAHIDRLYLSCRYARLDPGMSADEMEALTMKLIERNRGVYAEGEEFRINHWVTRGGGVSSAATHTQGAHTVVIFTLPMDYSRYAHGYREGVPSVVTGVRRIPPECIEPRRQGGQQDETTCRPNSRPRRRARGPSCSTSTASWPRGRAIIAFS